MLDPGHSRTKTGQLRAYPAIIGHGVALLRQRSPTSIEIDSNTVERAIRPLALNCKNALFAGLDGGGEHWANLASLIDSCKLNGVDPQAYSWTSSFASWRAIRSTASTNCSRGAGPRPYKLKGLRNSAYRVPPCTGGQPILTACLERRGEPRLVHSPGTHQLAFIASSL